MIFCVLLSACSMLLPSCEKESMDNPLEGSISVKMRNYGNGNTYIYFGTNDCVGVHISSANNFAMYSGNGYNAMVDVGSVKGLGSIKKIPDSGWNNEIAVIVGHGYIVRWKEYLYIDDVNGGQYSDYYYARIYVHSVIEGTNGGVLGYEVSYIEGM